jgi:hypothetical protein
MEDSFVDSTLIDTTEGGVVGVEVPHGNWECGGPKGV